MSGIGVSTEAEGGEAKGGAGWAIELASAIERCGDADYPRLLLDTVARLAPHDLAMIVVYNGKAKPVLVHHTFCDIAEKRGLTNYLNNTYALNPLHTAYCRGLATGVYRITDLVPDGHYTTRQFKRFKVKRACDEEIGYVTNGWPCGMQEITLVVELPGGELGEISLLRSLLNGGFNEADIDKLKSIEPILSATFRRHWASLRNHTLVHNNGLSMTAMIDQFSGGALSLREREVAALILQGHSGRSIGEHLGIAITTVKTHRRNLYAKLGIATHYELFSLLLR